MDRIPVIEVILVLAGLCVGLWLGMRINVRQRYLGVGFIREPIAKMQFNKVTLPLRSMLWRQIWQLELFIPLPDDSVIEEIMGLLNERDSEEFYKALIQFKKCRAIGPIREDYCEVSFTEEQATEIKKWANTLLGFL